MADRPLIIATVGAAIAAICCFTPVLSILLGAAGLAAAAVWLDPILIVTLVVCLAVIGYLLWRKRSN